MRQVSPGRISPGRTLLGRSHEVKAVMPCEIAAPWARRSTGWIVELEPGGGVGIRGGFEGQRLRWSGRWLREITGSITAEGWALLSAEVGPAAAAGSTAGRQPCGRYRNPASSSISAVASCDRQVPWIRRCGSGALPRTRPALREAIGQRAGTMGRHAVGVARSRRRVNWRWTALSARSCRSAW